MNFVDVDPTTGRDELHRRNVVHVLVIALGSLALIAALYALLFLAVAVERMAAA